MTKAELKELIFETYVQALIKRNNKLLKEAEEKETVFQEGAELPDATDQILAKFPTLKHCLENLQTEDFMEFVGSIDWICPKPTEFRINLKNGTNYTLKWMGEGFQANISGKKYYLPTQADFQKALEKLSILYTEGPMGEDEPEEPQGGSEPGPSGGGGGGNFPGEGGPEAGPGSEPGAEEAPQPEGEAGAEEPAEDVKDATIDFEADESI